MKASSCQRHALLGSLVLALALLQQVAWAAKDCAVTNRGWLTSGADRGVHPTGLFGPLGLHGEHKMNNDFSNSGIQIRVAEVFKAGDAKYDAEGGMTQTGSSSYDPFKVGGNGDLTPIRWYPGRLYRIEVTCSKLCAFLASVERGTRGDSFGEADVDNRAGLQVGVNDGFDFATPGVKAYKGIAEYTSTMNEMPLATSYTYYWESPNETLKYEDFSLRATIVQDDTTTCEGKFYRYELQSLLTCGDGIKDDLEECDDGTSTGGAGCSSECKVEVGYTCEEKVDALGAGGRDTLNREYKRSYCTKSEMLVDVLGGNGVYNQTAELALNEGGEASFTIVLSTTVKAGKEVFISLLPDLSDQISLSKSSLRFDESNAQIAQSIIVTSTGNFLRDEDRVVKIKYLVSSTDENYQAVTHPDTTVKILDDDVATLSLSTTDLTAVEDGAAVEFDLKLTTQPYGSVIVSFASVPSSQLMLNPSQLVFAPSDWNMAKKVSVVAIDNKVVEGKTTVKITPTITAAQDTAYEALNAKAANGDFDVTVQVEDNDIPGLVVTPNSMAIKEGASTTTYNYLLSLRSMPEEGTSVEVAFESPECSELDGLSTVSCPMNALVYDEDVGATFVTATFTTANWNIPQKVVVFYTNNDNVEWRLDDSGNVLDGPGSKIYNIEHVINSADQMYQDLRTTSVLYPYRVVVNVTDDDIPGVNHPEDITIREGLDLSMPDGFRFAMTLLSKPTSAVTIGLSLSTGTTEPLALVDSADGKPSEGVPSTAFKAGLQVYIPPEYWNVPRVVYIVSNLDDNVKMADRTVELTVQSYSQDPLYNGVLNKKIAISIVDDDEASVKMTTPDGKSAQGLTLREGDQGSVFEVYLSSQPTADMTLKLSPSSQVTVEPAQLVFTASNWSTKQQVTVKAVDDILVEQVSHQGVVKFELLGGDSIYTAVKVPDLSVTIEENDFSTLVKEVGPFGGVISPTEPVGAVSLNVPGGVLSESVSVRLKEIEMPLGGATLGSKENLSGSTNTYERVSGTYSFEPHGQTFDLPVYITIQYEQGLWDQERVKTEAQTRLVFLKKESESDLEWKPLAGGKFANGVATLATTSFSLYKVAIEKDETKPAEDATTAEARLTPGMPGADIAKCINGYDLTNVGSQCGFKYDDQVEATSNNIQVVVKEDSDEYRISILVIILLAVAGFEAIVILGLVISLNSKKAAGGTYGAPGNAIVPVANPANGALVPAKVP
ncbi:hypothetical protein HKI87_10g61660 [Chloropicon roscoffensis]|uniref:Uncharacterized protein n=1 Tax=Chloropicon roscoffensis TaxID=1461544 RepID=A0AAX4PFS6_9CHLO